MMLRAFLTSITNLRWEHGQGLAEYALILMLVAIALTLALGAVGGSLGELMDETFSRLADAYHHGL